MGSIVIYVGAVAITLWGIGHIAPTKAIVRGFGTLSLDNERILTMEWVAEGLTLCFLGLLVGVVTYWGGAQNPVSLYVYRMCASMLVVMAVLSSFTGARTSILPMKLCPWFKTGVAVMFLGGSVL